VKRGPDAAEPFNRLRQMSRPVERLTAAIFLSVVAAITTLSPTASGPDGAFPTGNSHASSNESGTRSAADGARASWDRYAVH